MYFLARGLILFVTRSPSIVAYHAMIAFIVSGVARPVGGGTVSGFIRSDALMTSKWSPVVDTPGVAIVKFKRAVQSGTRLHFKGATTDFEDVVNSMQYDHKAIDVAPKGKEIGIKVKDKVREGDEAYLID